MQDRLSLPGDVMTVVDVSAGNDLPLLTAILPRELQVSLEGLSDESLIEIVMDLGRAPEARMADRAMTLSRQPVTEADLRHVLNHLGDFTEDNRAGIERTLHRISAIRNRQGRIIGLTLRVGRAIFGTIDLLRDLIAGGLNILILGRPGVGKTTKLREATRVLADDYRRRVIVIDTSNEIAGDGDIPHSGIGAARRMQVPHPDRQHAVMIEAVENHMPEVIIVDEIGTEAEAAAARTIAERGVQLIGTAHGNTLENLLMNPTLSDLVGGVHTVTLSDEEARRRHMPKTINERRAPPTFDIVVEMVNRNEVVIHRDTAQAVDLLLAGHDPGGERRVRDGEGVHEEAITEPAEQARETLPSVSIPPAKGPVRIYPYALSRDLLERVIRDLRLEARAASRPEAADMILSLRSRADDARLRRVLVEHPVPVHTIKANSTAQMRRLLQSVFYIMEGMDEDEVQDAVRETEHAIQRVLSEHIEVALAPRRPALRKMQHRMISRYHLESESEGREPMRHLRIRPR